MKLIKLLSILILALCASYSANAQCASQISVSVNGNNISAKTPGSSDAYLYAWYLDGAHVAGPGLDTFYIFQNVVAGTHRVCLYAYGSNSGNFCDSVCESAVVTSCGTLTAQWTDVIGHNDTVTFTAYDTNSVAHHIFNFGDGASTSGTFVKHVYSTPGTYHVCFYSYIPGTTCSDSLCDNITIAPVVACDSMVAYWTSTLTPEPAGGSNGAYDSLFVSAITQPAGTVYSWNFGDGTSSSSIYDVNTHDYFTNGTYSVCLTVSNPGTSCKDTMCRSIVVSNPQVCGIAAFSAYILNDSTIRAYSTSTGTTDSTYYVWNVYMPNQATDGAPIQTQNTGHTPYFLSNALPIGNYRVCLSLYNAQNVFCDSFCNNVQVLRCSSLSAGWQYGSIPNTDSIQFYGPVSDPVGTTYAWTLGDGSTSSLPSPNHVYVQAGTYNVCLAVSNPALTCKDTFCQTITVGNPNACGVASFEYYVLNDSTIRGYSNSTGTTDSSSYVWVISYTVAGSPVIITIPTGHTNNFLSSALPIGSYKVCLRLYNALGTLCDSACNTVQVLRCSSLNASYFYTVGTNDSVKFSVPTNNPSGTTYLWTFGDGTSSTSPGLTHVYAQGGTYTACLIVSNPALTCHDTVCKSIVVTNTLSCGTASFSDYIYGDTSIHIYSTSTGVDSSTYYVYVVRNSSGTIVYNASGVNLTFTATHTLPAGTYSITLYTALSANQVLCDSAKGTTVIPLIGACGTAAFADTVYPGIGGGAIHAYTTSTNVDSASQYSWKIWGPNGGLVQTFTGQDFTSSTLDSGTYTVCQYIRQTGSTHICDSVCQTVVVGNSNPCAGLSAAWTYNLVAGTTDSVQFNGVNGPVGTYYRWTFGDGSYNYGQSIVHGYDSAGTYDVCLEVFIGNNSTCRDTSCRNITITTTTACPVAAFGDYVYGDTAIHAYSSSTGTTANTVYNWKVTNASGLVVATSTNTGTTSSFLTRALPNGTYNVCLFVSANSNTFCDSVCHTITVYDSINPCAGLNATFSETHLSNGDVQFTEADSAAGLTHYWHFGDGTIGTGSNPVHAYATAGLYHVCQYVYYAGSACLDSFCTNVQTGASGCAANFSTQGYYPPYNGVHFTNLSTSTDSIITYRWTFGDSTNASFASGYHVYPHSGTYYACLLIYAANGCTSVYCDTVNVSYDPCAGLSAAYTYTYTQSDGVHFVGSTNTTNATNYWTFGDGTTATTFDPIHYYNQPGIYTVCHIVTIPGTLCSDTSCQSIQGTGVGTSCHANFSDSTSSNSNQVFLTNTSTSTDSITSYHWSFGDGAGAYNMNEDHVYAHPGTYNLCLTITAANGCTNTYCDSVHVGTNTTSCHASFTYTVDSCQVVTFTSTSTGSLNFLRWIYGDGTTDTLSHPTHVYAQSGYYTVILHFYGNNGCYNFDTAVINVPSCALANDTVCGTVFEDYNGNGVQNTGEPGVASAEVHIGNYVTYTDSTGHYLVIVPAGSYTIYYCAPAGYTYSIPVHSPLNTNATCAAYAVAVGTGSHCGYNFGILVNNATICGTVYFDANNNHVQDPSESGIPNAQVVFTDSGHVVYTGYTDQYGHYCAVLPAGTYVITVGTNTYNGGVVTPGSITVTASAGGNYENNNFGVYVTPGSCDLAIKITPNTTITPGYPAWYQIQVCNVGPAVTSGIVNLFYDPRLTFNYGSPLSTSQNGTTFTASWDLNNLNPGSCQYYYVSLTADSTLLAGQYIFTLANVTTNNCNDANLANNVDTLHQTVTASWDPNNKQVSPIGAGTNGAISADQWLTYTISFQNTGTAPAVNIVVEDTLSANLDITTFKPLGSSMPYTLQLAGNEAIWKFNDVMLPDSSTDQQGSRGFVSFMILPLQGLAGNTQITNQADIFFDYNAGMTTNQTLNTIDYTLSVTQIVADNVTITLQPNPFSQYTTIKIDGTDGPYQLNVYDMLGRIVKAQTAAGNIFNVDRDNMAAGMYMYEIVQQGKVIGKGKMIAQ